MEWRTALTGTGGAGTGIGLSEFISEFVTRAAGLVDAAKFGVKALVKGLFGGLFYGLSARFLGLKSLFFEVAAYGSWGSILIDLIALIWAGGVTGLAEDAAVAVRARVIGIEKIAEELTVGEEKEKEKAVKKPALAATGGRYG